MCVGVKMWKIFATALAAVAVLSGSGFLVAEAKCVVKYDGEPGTDRSISTLRQN